MAPRRTYVPGEFVVKFSANVKAEEVGAKVAPASSNPRVLKTFRQLNAIHLKVDIPAATGVVAAAETRRVQAAVANYPGVEAVERNYLYYEAGARPSRAAQAPAGDNHGLDDPDLGKLWYLDKIAAFRGWRVRADTPDLIVAVIDTGVYRDHEDLQGNTWVNLVEQNGRPNVDDDNNGFVDDINGWDFFNNDNDPSPDLVDDVDVFGNPDPNKPKVFEEHGTHVSGTIGARGNNHKGIVGITRNVKIMTLKFLGGPQGSGDLAGAAAAVDYAAANGARIISASWGGGGNSTILRDAIQNANNHGVLFVCAAGNDSENNDGVPFFPANYSLPNMIVVAATDKADHLADFSNFGRDKVNLAAPGVDIFSTVPVRKGDATAPSSGYASLMGTSMATPIVSGTTALMTVHFPDLTHLDIKKLILQQVDGVDDLQNRVATKGRVNVAKSLSPPLPPGLAAGHGVGAAAGPGISGTVRAHLSVTPRPFRVLNRAEGRQR